MKKFLSLLIIAASTASFSAHAIGLESFYGRPVQRGLGWKCLYENTTTSAQSMKYVVFTFQHTSGDNADFDVQNRIYQVVNPGESLSAATDHVTGGGRVSYCRYLARR